MWPDASKLSGGRGRSQAWSGRQATPAPTVRCSAVLGEARSHEEGPCTLWEVADGLLATADALWEAENTLFGAAGTLFGTTRALFGTAGTVFGASDRLF